MSFERRFRARGGTPVAATPSSQKPSFLRDGKKAAPTEGRPPSLRRGIRIGDAIPTKGHIAHMSAACGPGAGKGQSL